MSGLTARILDPSYTVVELVKAEPECGEDFCDCCGDCLHCYWSDPCPCSQHGGEHRWLVYVEDATAERVGILDDA